MAGPFRLAFVGVDHPHGAGWRQLLHGMAEEIEIVALVTGPDGSIASLEERLAHLHRFERVDDLVAHADFDGALVCLPNRESVPALRTLVGANKHVLMEKPIAACAGALEWAVAEFRSRRLAFQCGYLWRYDDGANRLRAMVAEDRFTDLISIEMSWFTSDVQRRGAGHYLFDANVSGAGFFNWLGCHWLDLLMYVVPRPIVAVTARVGQNGPTPVDVEDGGTVVLELEGGPLVTFTGGYWLPRWTNEGGWSIRGSARWVHWRPFVSGTSGVIEVHGPQPQFLAMDETFTLAKDEVPGYGGSTSRRLVRDWLASAESGRPNPRNTIESAVNTLRLIDLVLESSRQGRRLECRVVPEESLP